MATINNGHGNDTSISKDEYYNLNDSGKLAEKKVCDKIEETINEEVFGGEVVGKYEATFSGRHADLVLVIPQKGILVIEIKAYSSDFIEDYTENDIIITKDGEKHRHPYDQVFDYICSIKKTLNKAEFIKDITEYRSDFCSIVCMIAMPNMSDKEIYEWGLDWKCDMDVIITSDWFVSENEFRKRFERGVEYAFNRIPKIEFDDKSYKAALTIVSNKALREARKNSRNNKDIESNQKINTETIENNILNECSCNDWKTELKDKFPQYNKTNKKSEWVYSKLCVINNFNIDSSIEEIEGLIRERKKGTKIILLCLGFENNAKQKVFKSLNKLFSNDITAKSDIKNINLLNNSWSTFLFEIHFLDDMLKGDTIQNQYIIDGKEIIQIKRGRYHDKTEGDRLWSVLDNFSEKTAFNLEQYITEHYDIDSNLIITAGAGTGKTFSMVGRIAFLVHKNIIEKYMKNKESVELDIKLSEMIYMMTFTNNSTEEMRKRLSAYFEKYYALTYKSVYMELIKEICNMKIKTIDSMAKFIIEKYAFLLGMTSNVSITSGSYRLKQIIRNTIQSYYFKIDEYSKYIDKKELQTYELDEIVEKIIEYLSQRSISLNDPKVSFADSISDQGGVFKKFLENVIKDCTNEYKKYCSENNMIEMSNIVTRLTEIKDEIREIEVSRSEKESKYLFIDEFQDTDNHQIQIVSYFAMIFKLKLFVVGDKKQGIYGFRGANDSAFIKLEEEGKKIGKIFEYLELKKNYRTDKLLLNTINEKLENWDKKYFTYEKKDVLVSQLIKHNSYVVENEFYHREEIENDDEIQEKIDSYIKVLREKIEKDPFNEKEEVISILVRKRKQIDKIKKMDKTKKWGIQFDSSDNFYRQDAVIDFYKMVCSILDKDNPQKVYSLSRTPYAMCLIPNSKFHIGNNNRIKSLKELDQEINSAGFDFRFTKYCDEISNNSALKLLQCLVNENKPWERYVPERLENEAENIRPEIWIDIDEERNYYKKCTDQLFQLLIENNGTEYITLNQIKDRLEIWINTWQKMQLFSSLSEETFFDKLSQFNSMGIAKVHVLDEVGESVNSFTTSDLQDKYDDYKDILNRKIKVIEYKENPQEITVQYKEKIRIICTTVHKSKGLEYRSVILPYTTTDIGNLSGRTMILDDTLNTGKIEYCLKRRMRNEEFFKSVNFDKKYNEKIIDQISEELRVLYVALTRAKGELYYIVNRTEQGELEKNKKEYWAKYI